MPAASYEQLPADLPVPEDDGAAAHLPGTVMPPITLPATSGETIDLANLGNPRAIVYVYPMTGTPGVPLPEGWDQIPGARGCTPESLGFRSHYEELTGLGAEVFGLSSQDPAEQAEAAARLALPFPLLSDSGLALAARLGLPTFPADRHAAEVLAWLREHPALAPPRSMFVHSRGWGTHQNFTACPQESRGYP